MGSSELRKALLEWLWNTSFGYLQLLPPYTLRVIFSRRSEVPVLAYWVFAQRFVGTML